MASGRDGRWSAMIVWSAASLSLRHVNRSTGDATMSVSFVPDSIHSRIDGGWLGGNHLYATPENLPDSAGKRRCAERPFARDADCFAWQLRCHANNFEGFVAVSPGGWRTGQIS
jgi:hypothetical protein